MTDTSMFLPLPDDFHAHLRQGDLMPGYVRDLVQQFGRAIIMPNTIPAMTSPLDHSVGSKRYASQLERIAESFASPRALYLSLLSLWPHACGF